MSHIKVKFDEDGIMHICPTDMLAAMALMQFLSKMNVLGTKAINIHTEVAPEYLEKDNPGKRY